MPSQSQLEHRLTRSLAPLTPLHTSATELSSSTTAMSSRLAAVVRSSSSRLLRCAVPTMQPVRMLAGKAKATLQVISSPDAPKAIGPYR